MAETHLPAAFTRFTSRSGALAKVMSLNEGKLKKEAAAQMVSGSFQTLTLDTSAGAGPRLVAMLSEWNPTQALSPSLNLGADSGEVVTKAMLSNHPGAVARDVKHFGFRADVGGLLVLDYDPPKGAHPLAPAALWDALLTLWPEAVQGIALHWVSGSSLIYNGDQQLTGIGGQRLYVVVKANADIPRTVKVLNQRAWLHGFGNVAVSAAGSLLTRSLFDSAMGEAARLDFAPAGAVCRDGLEQRRGPPQVLADGVPLDTPATLRDLTAAEAAEVEALIAAAKLKAQPEAEQRRAAWLVEREQVAAVEAVKTGNDPEEARRTVRRNHEALLSGVLLGGAELIHVDDDGREVVVKVESLLKDPKHWHGRRFLSPHEPEHRGRSPDAMAYLLQPVPTLFDLNDCVSYRLQGQPVRLTATQGNRAQLAEQIAVELAQRPDLFSLAGQVVRLVQSEFQPVTRPLLAFLIGTGCALFRPGKERPVPCDVDQQTVDMVLALLPERCRRVTGRSSVPLIDTQGRIAQAPGLDDASGLYLDLTTELEAVPASPTRAQTVAALKRLWAPWSRYAWTTPHCRAAMLSAILTVTLRPTIAAAPGLFVDAASQGAGKSSAIAALLCIAQGHRGGMKTWTADTDAELEKYALSLAKSGAAAVAYDNVVGRFESSVIATAVIEGKVQARLLGTNTALSPQFRALWLATGNNATLGPDCGTRFLQARIASPDGQPQRKSFPFEPGQAALADRAGIVHAILTVHRAWHAAGRPQVDGISTRFPEWGRSVRQMVLWLHREALDVEAGIGELGDPADSILNRAAVSDPDTEATAELFASLLECFGNAEPFTARDVAAAVRAGREAGRGEMGALADAVMGFLRSPSVQGIASLLRNRRDRVLNGLRLSMLPKGQGRDAERSGQAFAVVEV